tara:strand:+ start:520 stop:729 length:210 start_codon:yes stop_codon:yes gene_type:complete
LLKIKLKNKKSQKKTPHIVGLLFELKFFNYFNDTEAVSKLLKAFVTRLKSNPIALRACHRWPWIKKNPK